ncbi:hypothetical protein WS62_10730 [Burkholderia sp. ABCPW 14]|nr:hypothetical protein WS62_10730 [Burkholderia sp. ABCPW 14]
MAREQGARTSGRFSGAPANGRRAAAEPAALRQSDSDSDSDSDLDSDSDSDSEASAFDASASRASALYAGTATPA